MTDAIPTKVAITVDSMRADVQALAERLQEGMQVLSDKSAIVSVMSLCDRVSSLLHAVRFDDWEGLEIEKPKVRLDPATLEFIQGEINQWIVKAMSVTGVTITDVVDMTEAMPKAGAKPN